MLQITPEQFEAFEKFHLEQFRNELLEHFHNVFPERTDHLDKKVFARYIDDGIDEARAYGLISRQDICKFLNIKVVMKAKVPFDKEVHGWVIDMLRDKSIREPHDRLQKLADLVDAELKRMETGEN